MFSYRYDDKNEDKIVSWTFDKIYKQMNPRNFSGGYNLTRDDDEYYVYTIEHPGTKFSAGFYGDAFEFHAENGDRVGLYFLWDESNKNDVDVAEITISHIVIEDRDIKPREQDIYVIDRQYRKENIFANDIRTIVQSANDLCKNKNIEFLEAFRETVEKNYSNVLSYCKNDKITKIVPV